MVLCLIGRILLFSYIWLIGSIEHLGSYSLLGSYSIGLMVLPYTYSWDDLMVVLYCLSVLSSLCLGIDSSIVLICDILLIHHMWLVGSIGHLVVFSGYACIGLNDVVFSYLVVLETYDSLDGSIAVFFYLGVLCVVHLRWEGLISLIGCILLIGRIVHMMGLDTYVSLGSVVGVFLPKAGIVPEASLVVYLLIEWCWGRIVSPWSILMAILR
jgi:hypothetical protein